MNEIMRTEISCLVPFVFIVLERALPLRGMRENDNMMIVSARGVGGCGWRARLQVTPQLDAAIDASSHTAQLARNWSQSRVNETKRRK